MTLNCNWCGKAHEQPAQSALEALATCCRVPRRMLSDCDVCDERPGARIVWVHGIETVVCAVCAGDEIEED